MGARLMSQLEVRYWQHTSVTGETWFPVRYGTTTGAGEADGTTLVDTSGDSSGADAYNGYWVEILSGTLKGQRTRIVNDDGAGTLTLEGLGFNAQVAASVQYRILSSPDAFCVVDSSSSETNMVDATRTEADVDDADFWAGYYAIPITGTHRGKKALITAFVPGTGTFTLSASFGSALAAGDVVLLRKFIEVQGLALPDGPAYIRRPVQRANMTVGHGVPGTMSGQVSFETQVTASNSAAAADSAANPSVLSGLFQAAGLDESIGSSATVGAGSDANSIKIATGKRENFAIGQMVIWNGNATFIESMTDGGAGVDTLEVTPDLPGSPAENDVVYGTRMYKKSTTGDCYGVGIECEYDGVRYTLTGCKGSVVLTQADPLSLKWTLNVDEMIEDLETAPYDAGSAYTTAPVLMGSDVKAYLTETATDIGQFTASPNTAVVAKAVAGARGTNGRAGFQVTDTSKAGATFRELADSAGDVDAIWRYFAGTSKDLIVVFGSHANAFAVRLPAAYPIQYPKPTDDNGMMALPNVLEAHDAGTALDSTTVTKVPDFAFFIS